MISPSRKTTDMYNPVGTLIALTKNTNTSYVVMCSPLHNDYQHDNHYAIEKLDYAKINTNTIIIGVTEDYNGVYVRYILNEELIRAWFYFEHTGSSISVFCASYNPMIVDYRPRYSKLIDSFRHDMFTDIRKYASHTTESDYDPEHAMLDANTINNLIKISKFSYENRYLDNEEFEQKLHSYMQPKVKSSQSILAANN